MDASEYAKLTSSLPTMSQAQLTKLRRQLTFFLQHSVSTSTEPVESEDWLLLGILSELRRRGLEDRSDFRIRSGSSYASFSSQSESVRALILRSVPNFTAIQRRALGEVCARELARYLESWREPPTVSRHSLLMYVSRVPEALDRSYPGYMAAGLLHLVVSSR